MCSAVLQNTAAGKNRTPFQDVRNQILHTVSDTFDSNGNLVEGGCFPLALANPSKVQPAWSFILLVVSARLTRDCAVVYMMLCFDRCTCLAPLIVVPDLLI